MRKNNSFRYIFWIKLSLVHVLNIEYKKTKFINLENQKKLTYIEFSPNIFSKIFLVKKKKKHKISKSYLLYPEIRSTIVRKLWFIQKANNRFVLIIIHPNDQLFLFQVERTRQRSVRIGERNAFEACNPFIFPVIDRPPISPCYTRT